MEIVYSVRVTSVFSSVFVCFFFFKQKTAYEMRISDWSSDVCSSDLYAWATALYASFQATEKLRLNARADYTKGSDGTYYDGGNVIGADDSNELGSLTLTADYSLWANVITRAEVRWDHAMSGDRPFPDTNKDAVTLAANFIYKF